MVDIQSLTAEIRQGKKERKKDRQKKPQDKNIMSTSAMQGGHNEENTMCLICLQTWQGVAQHPAGLCCWLQSQNRKRDMISHNLQQPCNDSE